MSHEDIVEAFHFYDTKGDKKISVTQIGNCLRSLNLQPTQKTIEIMTKQWKDTPDARISIEEFTPILQNVKKIGGKDASFEDFQNLLAHYDRDNAGFIMIHDLRFMLENAGEKISPEEVDLLLSNLDVAEGKILIPDLIRYVMSL